MKEHPVAFIAFREFDNLGIGYMASVLSDAGYETCIIDFNEGEEKIIDTLKRVDPLLIGFSVIFQNYIGDFQNLIKFIKREGIKCHLTAGGHFASLRYESLFELMPELDSAVRFEGEYTLLELVKCIETGAEWKQVKGIAYKNKSKIIANPLRPLETDLDRFPFPLRSSLNEYAFGKKFSTILAGRGCVHDCSFCDIREFYRYPPGPNKRIRRPEMVVKEMEYLFHEKQCSVFLFQDDDFPLKTEQGSEWIIKFCRALKFKDLTGKIMWKINCRPDEIDNESFTMMKNHGLFLVFLGIEDGTDNGLKRLNKNLTAAKSLEGITILKKLEIGFDYGFMLFQPSSTFTSINENLDFLRQICGDGYTPVTFLKTLPYFETHVEKELAREGRLKGDPGFLDYDFLDKSLDRYYDFTTDCFMKWLRAPDGLVNISKWARNYFSVYSRFFDFHPDVRKFYSMINGIISESNLFLLDTMQKLIPVFESERYDQEKNESFENYRKSIDQKHEDFKRQIHSTMTKLLLLARDHQFI